MDEKVEIICIEPEGGDEGGIIQESAHRGANEQQQDEDHPYECRQLLQGEQQPALSIKHETPTEKQQLVTSNHGTIEENYMYAAGNRTTGSCNSNIVKTAPATDEHLDSKDNIIDGIKDCAKRDVEPTQTVTWIPPIICKREVKSETYVDTDSITAIWVALPATEDKQQSTIYPMEHTTKIEKELVINSYCSLAQQKRKDNDFKVEGSFIDGNQTDVKVENTEFKKACSNKFINTKVMDQCDKAEPEQVCVTTSDVTDMSDIDNNGEEEGVSAANTDIASDNIDDNDMDPVRPEVYIDVDTVNVEEVTDTGIIKTSHNGNKMIRTRRCFVLLVRVDAAEQLTKASTSDEHVETNEINYDTTRKRTENMRKNEQTKRPRKKARHRCRVCEECFKCPSNLKRHLRIHTGTKPYHCLVCDKYFVQKSHLTTHMTIHTGTMSYQCPVCDKCFAQNSNLTAHMRIHSGKRPYACSVCGKSFTQSYQLMTHMRHHTREKPYECSVCEKSFARKAELTVHTRVHTGEKPYECYMCGKSFARSHDLTIHTRKHTGEKPYECTVCGKGFVKSSDLTVHKRRHTGEKPYECSLCEKSYAHRNALRRHEQLHSGYKPYPCSVCDKSFARKDELTVHARLHTGEKPYECSVCGKGFAQSSDLKRHGKQHRE